MEKNSQTISKGRKIVGSVLLLLCAAVLLWCAAVMIYRLATVVEAKRMGAVTRFLGELGILFLVFLPVLDLRFGVFTWRRNKAARAVGITLRVIACGFCAIYIALVLAVTITGTIRDDDPVDAVCVLGLAIDKEDLSEDLVHRLDTALEYKAAHPDVAFIVTGGNSDDPEATEAAQMARYLIEHGFDTESGALIREDQAKTTVENFEYSAAFVDKNASVGVVTSNCHIFRATHIAKKQGYTSLVKIPAPSEPLLYPENVVWEGVCCIFETLRGHMAY